MLVALGGGDSTKALCTDPSYWELICSKSSNVFEPPGTPSDIAIKYIIDLLLDYIHSAKK